MKLHELKEFTLYYILEHDNLTKKEKLQLGEFVKEANEDQVNYLLLTGEAAQTGDLATWPSAAGMKFPRIATIVGEHPGSWISSNSMKRLLTRLDNFAKQQSKAGFAKGYSSGRFAGIATAATAALVAYAAYKIYKNFFSKAAKSCRNLGGEKKQVCMFKFRKLAYREQIKSLGIGKQACLKTKNPKKCGAKIDRKIHKVRMKLAKSGEK